MRYEIQLADGRTVSIADHDPLRACERATDLYQSPATAWRNERYVIAPVHHTQIIG